MYISSFLIAIFQPAAARGGYSCSDFISASNSYSVVMVPRGMVPNGRYDNKPFRQNSTQREGNPSNTSRGLHQAMGSILQHWPPPDLCFQGNNHWTPLLR
ncbi:hypothetical protein NPIL_37181 [Nephila pilipes]|uniref:Secreted protein n=1 Tax=Nephila pilipes TaxID=299642 RepID=A0A8X6N1Q0_NEPPI|nr:hypothetical protein NPIL_37181 [Nephila pilipes]